MALPLYLAMTSSEISRAAETPANCAYMACHFSPYGTGISNFPQMLPNTAILIINDRTPVQGHDPALILQQLHLFLEDCPVSGVLLDFQRIDDPQSKKIVQHLIAELPCPVCVSKPYIPEENCPVFLPPPPPDMALPSYIAPYRDREIWLEVALDRKAILLTESGSRECTPPLTRTACQHRDSRLHCSYDITVQPGQVLFSMQRTADDLQDLLSEAEELGVQKAFGLYQELGEFFL